VAGLDLAEIDESDAPLLVDGDVQRHDPADGPDDFDLLLVQGIPLDDAIGGFGMLEDARSVERQDGVLVGDPRGDHLAASGVPGHEVGLHQAGDDFQVGLEEAPVDQDRDPPARFPEVRMGTPVPGEVVPGADGPEHLLRADDLPELLPLVGTVQPGGHEDQDVFPGDAGAGDRLDEGREQRAVGHGPRDVADEDAGALPAAGHLRKRRGPHRVLQRLLHGPERFPDGIHRMLADHRDTEIVRQPDRQGLSSVQEVDVHGWIP
jgi:hypothetical protein